MGGKLFAIVGAADEAVSLKCRDIETAGLLIELGRAERAPYLHRSWVRIPLGRPRSDVSNVGSMPPNAATPDLGGTAIDEAEFAARLLASYRLIRSTLLKKLQRTLPAPPPK